MVAHPTLGGRQDILANLKAQMQADRESEKEARSTLLTKLSNVSNPNEATKALLAMVLLCIKSEIIPQKDKDWVLEYANYFLKRHHKKDSGDLMAKYDVPQAIYTVVRDWNKGVACTKAIMRVLFLSYFSPKVSQNLFDMVTELSEYSQYLFATTTAWGTPKSVYQLTSKQCSKQIRTIALTDEQELQSKRAIQTAMNLWYHAKSVNKLDVLLTKADKINFKYVIEDGKIHFITHRFKHTLMYQQ